jgi:hypothetical protein
LSIYILNVVDGQTTREIVRRDWELVAKGTRMTHEFASFKRNSDNTAIDCRTIGGFFGIDGKKAKDNIKKHLSSFITWEPEHAHQWIIYPKTWELIYLLMK